MPKNKTPQEKAFNVGYLSQWAFSSFIIVSLPLVFAVTYTVLEVGSYTEKSQLTIFKAVQETESTRIILERLASMQRNIGQIQLFGKSVFYNLYLKNRSNFLTETWSLRDGDMGEKLIQQLIILRKNEERVFDHISKKLEAKSETDETLLSQQDLDAFDQLTQQARNLLSEAESRVITETTSLSAAAKQVKHQLIILTAVSVFLALLLAILFVQLLTRPINDLAQSIRSLGEVGFKQPIFIRGPKDLQELGIELEWLRVKLESVDHEKQQFIVNISHELKTPLASLKEGIDLLSDSDVVGELNPSQQEIIELMKLSDININNLVVNLLEYQKSISTKIIFNCSTFKLEHLINKVTDEYELILRSKNITLNTHLKSTQINADYEKLQIIISNVFSNALKFSPKDSSIGLSLSSHANVITLMIEDQGPGITKEKQSLIFDDFYQGNSPPDWNIKSSGLGLALVKHYIIAHKGSIKLLPASKSYCGARFFINLPQQ